MNILYFVHGFPPSIGAAAINTFKIVNYLSEYNHKFLILSPGVFSKSKNSNYLIDPSNSKIKVCYSSKIIKIPFNLVFSHYENIIKYLVKLKSSFKPDIIISQFHAYHYASVVGGYLSKILKIPHIIRSHDIFFLTENFSLLFKLFHKSIYTRIFRSILDCETFYLTTTEMKKYYLRFKKLQNVNFKVQHNGIDSDEFFPSNNQEELKDRFGCENIILFVGQISRDYDLQYILNIIPDIVKNYKDTHFLIIGSGPHEGLLLNYIKKQRLTNQVHFYGLKPHNEIPFFINNSDIGIGRITRERIWRYMIPVKCLEYMACGKPFITAKLSEDIIKDNDVGLLLNRDFTKKEIVEKFNILLEDKAYRKKLGNNGYKKVNQKFRWENIIADFNKDLFQIIPRN